MTVMEYMNAHREDMDPCECVILPDGSVEEPQPSHIKKLEEISGEDKLTLNSRMEKNMEPIFFIPMIRRCGSILRDSQSSTGSPIPRWQTIVENCIPCPLTCIRLIKCGVW